MENKSSFTIRCPYCEGEGVIHEYEFGDQPCPIKGCKNGLLAIEGIKKDYKRCSNCNGEGKFVHRIYGQELCKSCKGTGLVKLGK